jgi:hypothetical protein
LDGKAWALRYPWVNTLLLVFVPFALATGYSGRTNGHPSRAWILWLHAVAAYAIVAVAAWTVTLVRRSLARRPFGSPARSVFLLISYAMVFTMLSGMAWAWLGRTDLGGTSLITFHGGLAAVVAVPFVWHVIDSRTVFKIKRARDRRASLPLAVAGTSGLVFWQGALLCMRLFALQGARRRFTGSYETGSRTRDFPSVSWLFDDPEPVALVQWLLRAGGEVAAPLALTYEALLRLPATVHEGVLDCTGGWYTRQERSEAGLAEILARAELQASAASVTVTAVTGRIAEPAPVTVGLIARLTNTILS